MDPVTSTHEWTEESRLDLEIKTEDAAIRRMMTVDVVKERKEKFLSWLRQFKNQSNKHEGLRLSLADGKLAMSREMQELAQGHGYFFVGKEEGYQRDAGYVVRMYRHV